MQCETLEKRFSLILGHLCFRLPLEVLPDYRVWSEDGAEGRLYDNNEFRDLLQNALTYAELTDHKRWPDAYLNWPL